MSDDVTMADLILIIGDKEVTINMQRARIKRLEAALRQLPDELRKRQETPAPETAHT